MWKLMSVSVVVVAMGFVVAPGVQADPVPLPSGYDLPTGDHGFALYVRLDLEPLTPGVVPLHYGASEVTINTLWIQSEIGLLIPDPVGGPPDDFSGIFGTLNDMLWMCTGEYPPWSGIPFALHYTTPELVDLGGKIAPGTDDLIMQYGNARVHGDVDYGTIVYVPEPGTLAILLSGLLGSALLLWTRRR